jgi:hypothetical protein
MESKNTIPESLMLAGIMKLNRFWGSPINRSAGYD